MRIFYIFLLAGTAILAFPSQQSNLIPRSPATPDDTLTLTQAILNETSPHNQDWPTICYRGTFSFPVTRDSCAPLINYIVTRAVYTQPKIWLPGTNEEEWTLQGCKVKILRGKQLAMFSMRDVVVEMVRVLAICQPPKYMGVGGMSPVAGKVGFMYEAFHVQVTAVE